jgi:uncharacterized protein (TIGR01244 family)
MEMRVLGAQFAVTGQLHPASLVRVFESGFKSIINNRPDGEGGATQPNSLALAGGASAVGLEYAYLPLDRAVILPPEIERFRALLCALPKPILAFCATGRRSAQLYKLANAGTL